MARVSRRGDEEREFRTAPKGAEASQPTVEPTEEEKRNGWTTETLTAYHAEQRAAQSLKIDPNSAFNRRQRRPTRANSRYRPQRWRG